ncbi:MAG: hypothetical protein K8R31_08065 [Bacteroidales bacterium]|nr:hypothetical protein [Bacteroidales bacterium]
MKKLFFYSILCSFVILFSCESELDSIDQLEESNMADSYGLSPKFVENGVLHFDTVEELQSTLDVLTALSPEERRNWEEKYNFTSYLSEVENANEALANVKTEQELQSVLNKYKNVIELKDSIVTEIIPSFIYHFICNAEGYYSTGDYINKVDNEKNSFYKLEDFKNSKNLKSLESVFDKSFYDLNKAGAFPTELEERKTYGKRRLVLKASSKFIIYYNNGQEKYVNRVTITALGYKKTWFGWYRYKTQLEMRDIYYTVNSYNPETNAPATFTINRPDKSTSNDSKYLSDSKDVGQGIQSSSSPLENVSPGFFSLHVKASSRGIGNNWVVISHFHTM